MNCGQKLWQLAMKNTAWCGGASLVYYSSGTDSSNIHNKAIADLHLKAAVGRPPTETSSLLLYLKWSPVQNQFFAKVDCLVMMIVAAISAVHDPAPCRFPGEQ
jgi:hypothetical protein